MNYKNHVVTVVWVGYYTVKVTADGVAVIVHFGDDDTVDSVIDRAIEMIEKEKEK